MEKLESIQYSAALAVSEVWKGTSREKLYADLAGNRSPLVSGADALYYFTSS